MTKILTCLLACTFLWVLCGGTPVFAQHYTCATLEKISEVDLLKNEKTQFVIFAENNHEDNITNKQYVFEYLLSVRQQGFNQLLFEIGPSYEYLAGLNDTLKIKGFMGPLNYGYLKKVTLYNQQNIDTPIKIRGFDVETYSPFALDVLDFIISKYDTSGLNELHSGIERINLITNGEVGHDTIVELTRKIQHYLTKSESIVSEIDSIYLYKIANMLEAGILFNFKDWELREKHIYQNLESISYENGNKSVMLIGSQHVDKYIYKRVPSFYSQMITNGILKEERDNPPIILFKMSDKTIERLKLYKLSKKDREFILQYLEQHSGLTYCKNSGRGSLDVSYLFYE